ncbi:MAG TPA: hypothetical protein VFV68_07330 [Agriterribacter sp.]|nr:hypothetical protein [Agriterribacter sp.]
MAKTKTPTIEIKKKALRDQIAAALRNAFPALTERIEEKKAIRHIEKLSKALTADAAKKMTKDEPKSSKKTKTPAVKKAMKSASKKAVKVKAPAKSAPKKKAS